MKSKISEALKNKYKNLGFADSVFESMSDYLATQITDENNIETGVSGVEPLLKSWQSEIDRRMASIPKPTKTPEIPKSTEPLTDIQKAIADAMKPFADEIAQLKTEKLAEGLKTKLVSDLKAKNIPEQFYNKAIEGRNFKDETEIQTWVNELDTNWNAIEQSRANSGLNSQGQPSKGDVTALGDKAVQDDIKRLGNSF